MIAVVPETFAPLSSRTDGTVRAPNRMRCTTACIGGSSSTTS
jgi:hypothetical protein